MQFPAFTAVTTPPALIVQVFAGPADHVSVPVLTYVAVACVVVPTGIGEVAETETVIGFAEMVRFAVVNETV